MNLTNLPQIRDKEEYAVAQHRFLDIARSYPDIRAVYTGGTVTHPGISDLDFVLALNDTLQQPLDIEEKLDPEIKSVIGKGSILKINTSNMATLKIIDDFPLQHLQGEQYHFAEYTSIEYEICRFLDWMPERLFRIWQLQTSTEIDVIHTLQLLKSLTVSLKKLQEITGSTSHDSFINRVYQLRANWFTLTSPTVPLHNLIQESSLVAIHALTFMDRWLRHKGYIEVGSGNTTGDYVFAIPPKGPQWWFSYAASISRRGIVVPYTVRIFLQAQAESSPGFIAEHVRTSFGSDSLLSVAQYIKPELLTAINSRMAYIESVADFFRRSKLQRGLLKYGWFVL